MLLILFLVRLAMGYQFQSIASVSSHLVGDFGFSYAEVGILIGFFLLPGLFVAIPSGLMTRTITDKNLLMAGAMVMIAGALIVAFATAPSALYGGRLVTGVGGTIFNIILTKMVTEWFFEKEIITALAVMLTAWPAGIALGLLSQGVIADLYGWPWAMHATGALALASLLLTALFYQDAPAATTDSDRPSRYGLPKRQFVHTGVVGIAWTLFNTSFIVVVSFAPDVLVEGGYTPDAARSATSLFMWVTLVSVPLGGRILEVLGHVTPAIATTLLVSAAAIVAISQGMAPEVSFIVLGIFVGIPAGALMALSAEAVSAENRGPGLGIFYTWYYAGMSVGPALAGWTRDVSGSAAAPILLAAAMMVLVVLSVGVLRLVQRVWPIEPDAPATTSRDFTIS